MRKKERQNGGGCEQEQDGGDLAGRAGGDGENGRGGIQRMEKSKSCGSGGEDEGEPEPGPQIEFQRDPRLRASRRDLGEDGEPSEPHRRPRERREGDAFQKISSGEIHL